MKDRIGKKGTRLNLDLLNIAENDRSIVFEFQKELLEKEQQTEHLMKYYNIIVNYRKYHVNKFVFDRLNESIILSIKAVMDVQRSVIQDMSSGVKGVKEPKKKDWLVNAQRKLQKQVSKSR